MNFQIYEVPAPLTTSLFSHCIVSLKGKKSIPNMMIFEMFVLNKTKEQQNSYFLLHYTTFICPIQLQYGMIFEGGETLLLIWNDKGLYVCKLNMGMKMWKDETQETINKMVLKHCQRHNGPKGCLLSPKELLFKSCHKLVHILLEES